MLYNDQDFSFIRLRNNQDDATDTFSPAVEWSYAGLQIHLKTGEPVLQITNSPVDIDMETYQVELLDSCGNVLEDITENVFITAFSDRNGVSQIAWEWVNQSNHEGKLLQMRWTNTGNADGEYFWSNYFLSSDSPEMTVRFDYSSNLYHYGTDYEYAGTSSQTSENYFQSIRLQMYFTNTVNESERAEYHEISTNVTVSARNIRKWKEKYILDTWDDWTAKRLETLLTNDEIYLESYRAFSSTPVEFGEREENSDIWEGEAIINRDYSQKYDWAYQEFSGGVASGYYPTGSFSSGTTFPQLKITYDSDVVIQSGAVTVYDSGGDVVGQFTEADAFVANGNEININTGGSLPTTDDTYYVNVTEGFASVLNVDTQAVSGSSEWAYTLQATDWASADYNSDDYLTG